MEHSGGADVYLNEVLTHVRWKKAHGVIRQELSDHIEDARLGFLAQGINDGEAQEKAVMEMGDASDVGARFDKAYRPQKNYVVWIPFLLLLITGVLLRIYSAWPRELSVYIILAPAVFLGLCFLRFEWFVKFTWPLYGVYLALFLASFFIGFPLQGSSHLSGYLPLLFPLVYALLIYRMRGQGLMSVLILGIAFVLQMLPALSTSRISLVILVLVCLSELLYSVFSGWFSCRKWAAALLILVPTLLFIVFVLLLYAPHRDPYLVSRLTAAFSATEGMYYPAITKSILIKTTWFGAADVSVFSMAEQSEIFGNSNVFLNDFLLSWLSVRLGRVVFVLVGVLFATFFAFAFRAALRQKSMLYRLASLGVTLHLFMQFAGYFLLNLGIAYLFTYPLPFVSSGDAAMFVNAALMGLLFSMLYNGALMDDGAEVKYPRWRVKIVKDIV